jgi:hypothetical protein
LIAGKNCRRHGTAQGGGVRCRLHPGLYCLAPLALEKWAGAAIISTITCH